jgi:hypothetical protein
VPVSSQLAVRVASVPGERAITPMVPPAAAATNAPKKTIESVTKESYFSKEIEDLKSLVTELSAQVLELKEAKAVELSVEQTPKPIVHNPESAKPFETKIPKSANLDPVKSSIYAMLSK